MNAAEDKRDHRPCPGEVQHVEQDKQASFASRVLSRNAAGLLARNTAASCIVFGINLALLWVLTQSAGMGELTAASVAFVAANSVHYALSSSWIFRGTQRDLRLGFAYFLVNGLIGLGITMALYAAMLALTSLHYITARILVSLIAGLIVFLLNATLNFRSL